MAKKLNSMPDYTAHLPKHPHDVSQSQAYTCCPGMLCPVYYDMLHLGDELHFSASEFVRLNPLEQQPLGDIDVHLDYFFVPLTVMYTPSSSLFYQTDDLVSGIFGGGSASLKKDGFPVMDISTWLTSKFVTRYADACTMFGLGANATYLPVTSFDCNGKSVYRIWDFLDMSPDVLLDAIRDTGSNSATSYPDLTPWFALAYQACYQLYYRNDDREPKNYHYNIDNFFSTGVIDEPYGSAEAKCKSIFNMNYASRPKDYFNSVKVSPIGSSVSLLSESALQGLYGQVNQWINTSQMIAVNAANSGAAIDNATNVRPNDNHLSSANIRQMFMVEKLLRVVGRAEKNYESQFLAHYGIKIPHDVMHNITHLGHDMITIKPEAVISQANTWNESTGTGSALGEIGGKGSGMLSGRKRSFTAPFHGVFLCISHIVPRRRYVLGLNKLHGLTSVNKFWQPEFDQKGMQPLFTYEAAYEDDISVNLSSRVGWQFAYEEFKRKSDKVSHAFMPTRLYTASVNTYAPWVISNLPYSAIDINGNFDFNAGANYLVHRLVVSPTDLNVNMQVPYNPQFVDEATDPDVLKPWLLYQTDPFICDFNMYCKKVNRMSEYGEPEL